MIIISQLEKLAIHEINLAGHINNIIDTKNFHCCGAETKNQRFSFKCLFLQE